jgi:hypothetical protein
MFAALGTQREMHHIVMDGLHLCENESFYEILTGKASDLD